MTTDHTLEVCGGRDWRKFLNKQKYSECTVVSAINAMYWLTGRTISQDSKQYEKLVDLAGARHGSALRLEKVHKKLKIHIVKEYDWLMTITRNMLPLEMTVWHKAYGFHSILAIDCEQRSEAIRITNFDKATSMYGWIFFEDLQHFLVQSPSKCKARKFGLMQ